MMSPSLPAPAEESPPLIRALLVDLDGTLYPALPVRLAMTAELLLSGWPAIGVLRTFRHEHERLRSEPADESPYQTQLQRTAARLGRPVDVVESTVRKWMQLRPGKWLWQFRRSGLLAAIRNFHHQGGRTALVSDYPASAKLAALEATDCFDVVVASGEWPTLTRLKPSPQGYLAAAQQLAVAPGECLVIGDRDDTDGAAAQSAGMHYVRIKHGRNLQLPVAPHDHVIS